MVVPVIEGQVLDQRLQMFEEGLSRRQSILHGVVRGINPVQGGVRQEGQQDLRGEKIGQVLFAMAEVVLKMVALGFERVVVLVLGFPACATCSSQFGNIVVGDVMGSGSGVADC